MSEIRLQRLEVWTDLECAGGTRVAFWAPDPVRARVEETINGAHTLDVGLDRTAAAWDESDRGRVLRALLTDGSIEEFRIEDPSDGEDSEGQVGGDILAYAPIHDLDAGVVERIEADGTVYHDFELTGLTPAQHLAVILDAAPAWFELGTVEITEKIDVAYRSHSPLEAIQQMLRQLQKGEIELERDGATRYLLHIRAERGSTVPTGYFTYGRSLHGVNRKIRGIAAGDRIYPLGAALERVRHTMADALWEVTGVAATVLTLDPNPVALDGQLDGLFAEIEGTETRTEITASDRDAGTITVASAAGIGIGTRLRICRDAAGTDLTYLDRPGVSGIRRHRVLERQDIPPTENLVENAYLDQWVSGSPVGWSAIGGASLAEDNTAPYHRHGLASAQIVSLAEEGGIESDWIDVFPSEAHPFFLSQVTLFPAEGVWRVELIAENAAAEQTIIPDFARAFTSVRGQWVERLAVQDQATNFLELEIVRVKLRLVADQLSQDTGQASCYFDAGLVQQTHLPQAVFYPGRASVDLWLAGNELLLDLATLPTELDVSIHDLGRLDSAAFSYDRIELGQTVLVRNPDLGMDILTRIRTRVRDLLQGAATEVEMSTEVGEITDLTLDVSERRVGVTLPGGAGDEVDGDPLLDEDDPNLYLNPRRKSGAKSIRYVVSEDPLTPNDVLAGTASDSNDQILLYTFTPPEDGLTLHVGVAYYPGAGATGKVGGIHFLSHTFHVGDDPPLITHRIFNDPDPTKVRIGITITDDGDQVVGFHRAYPEGGTPPAFTRAPTTGFVTDPHSFTEVVDRPLTDAEPDTIFEAYAEDATGNRSKVTRFAVNKDTVLLDPFRVLVEEKIDQVGSAGSLELVITNRGELDLTVKFKPHTGGGDVDFSDPSDGSWTEDPSAPYTSQVTIDTKHPAKLGYHVSWLDLFGDVESVSRVITYDIDTIAKISGQAYIAADGEIGFDFDGDNDTAAVRYMASATAQPDAGTVATSGTIVVGRFGNVDTGVLAGQDQRGFVTVVPFRDAAATEGQGPALELRTHAHTKVKGAIEVGRCDWITVNNPGGDPHQVIFNVWCDKDTTALQIAYNAPGTNAHTGLATQPNPGDPWGVSGLLLVSGTYPAGTIQNFPGDQATFDVDFTGCTGPSQTPDGKEVKVTMEANPGLGAATPSFIVVRSATDPSGSWDSSDTGRLWFQPV